MLERIESFRSEASLRRGLEITVRPDDVFISTYSKSGTTWLQHVVHGLRSNGSMDFDEISAVVPWLESAVDVGIDPDADQAWSPRAFKAHLTWDRIPKGGRYVTAFRDPATVLPSFYRFFEGWWFTAGTVSIEEFAFEFYMGGSESGRHWDHLTSWYPQVGQPDVLALAYEDMVEQPDRVPPLIARFLDIELDRATMAKVVEQSSRAFMAAHQRQFDEHLTRDALDARWGLPPGEATTKVQAGPQDDELSQDILDALHSLWAATVEPKLGLDSYAAFRRSLPNPLGAARR